MKHYVLIAAAILFGATAHAQFYVAASGGYAFGSAGARTGVELQNNGNFKAYYGSAGQGANGQLRVGYFFNETFGIDLGFGYLASADQNISSFSQFYGKDTKGFFYGNKAVNATSKSNVIGFSPSLTYKFSKNIYGRFGALLKVGGNTEISGKINVTQHRTADLTGIPGAGLSSAEPITIEVNADFTAKASGKLPFGFLAALGYKYDLNNKISLFVEGEYMGISVKSESLEFTSFKGTSKTFVNSNPALVLNQEQYDLNNLPVGVSKKTEYKDESDNPANLANKTPYSSFGLNFGIMYSF